MRVTQEEVKNYEPAARRLVNGFSAIPQNWVQARAQVLGEEGEGDGPFAMPMWGTLFKVEDSCDSRKILELAARDEDREWAEEINDTFSLEVEPEEDEDDDDFVERVKFAWDEVNSEDFWLHMAGWNEVGDTGILALEFDGELLLGINGAGYGFYESHWIPLYKALGYKWHDDD